MGVDLRLLPFDYDGGSSAYSHQILTYDGTYDFYDEINKLPQMPVPKSFHTFCSRDEAYEESRYGNTQETPYGERVKFVLAGDLVKIESGNWPQARATRAFLRELPPETKVALFWH
jgi:hypothetical protein